MEHCVQAWAPYRVRDWDIIEKVQRLATRRIRGTNGMSYSERLQHLGLFSMARRRLRGDLIEVFRQLKTNDFCLVKQRSTRQLRGHQYHLEKSRRRLDVRKYFFTNRVVNFWNRLPGCLVEPTSVPAFKAELDRKWPEIFPEIL